ncbi:hypothetical protein VNI00_012056 [Paramarasmius palmivorus]|uniref:F-box protein n=1 Tax=Paramarasmius palmivorus TaxID=297713 RepID=A0AAW0C7F7_9AGAR
MDITLEKHPDLLDRILSASIKLQPSLRYVFLSALGSRIHASAIRVLFASVIIEDDSRLFYSPGHSQRTIIYPLLNSSSNRYSSSLRKLTICNPIKLGDQNPDVEPCEASQIERLLSVCSNLEEIVWTSAVCPPDGLAESGTRSLAVLLSDLGEDNQLESLLVDLLWLDEMLCDAIAEVGKRLRKLRLTTCGTKLTDPGVVSILESCDDLEEFALDEVQESLQELVIAKQETRPTIYNDQPKSLTNTDDIPSSTTLPGTLSKRLNDCEQLRYLHCDYWAFPYADLKSLLQSCRNLQRTKICLDFPFSKLLTLSSTFGALAHLYLLSVSIVAIHAPGNPPDPLPPHHTCPNTALESQSLKSRHALPQLLDVSQMNTQTCLSRDTGDPSMPVLRDVKRFAKKCSKLEVIEWYGRVGRGTWFVKRLTPGLRNNNCISVDYAPPRISSDDWDRMVGSDILAKAHEHPWFEATRFGQEWTGEQAEMERRKLEDKLNNSPLFESRGKKERRPSISTQSTSTADSPVTPVSLSPISLCRGTSQETESTRLMPDVLQELPVMKHKRRTSEVVANNERHRDIQVGRMRSQSAHHQFDPRSPQHHGGMTTATSGGFTGQKKSRRTSTNNKGVEKH